MASGIQENTQQPQTALMIRNLPSSTNPQSMTNQTHQNNNLEMENSTNSFASDHNPNSTDIESQIPTARQADEVDINRKKKILIKLVEPLTYFCGASVIGGIGFNATMEHKHRKGLLWIVTLLLLCDFFIFLFIRILIHNISTRLTSWLPILEKLVYLALGILVIALCTAVMCVK